MKKPDFILLFSVFFLTISSLSSVSAYYLGSIRSISQDLVYTTVDLFEPIFGALFGGYAGGYIFETLLLFILIASMVYIAVDKIPQFRDQKAVKWILTILVPLLGVRWVDYDWLLAVLDSYHLLAIIFSAILPFLLYFYFLYSAIDLNSYIRKLGWALFIVVYYGLWTSANYSDFTSNLYFWTFIAGIVCIVFDKKIYQEFMIAENTRKNSDFVEMQIIQINKEIEKVVEAVNSGATDRRFGERRIHELEGMRKMLLKHKYG